MSARRPRGTETKADEKTLVASRHFTWTAILDLVRREGRRLVLGNLCAAAATVALVVLPLLLPALVDEVILGRPGKVVAALRALLPTGWATPVGFVAAMTVLTLLLRFLSILLGSAQSLQFTSISKAVSFEIRSTVLDHLRITSLRDYETLGAGAVASRLLSDLATLENFIGRSTSRLVVNCLTILTVGAILLLIHWQLALAILLLNPIVLLGTTRLGERVRTLKRQENEATEVFQTALVETLDAIQQLRAANREGLYFTRLQSKAAHVRERSIDFSLEKRNHQPRQLQPPTLRI